MSRTRISARATLEGWREQGADRMDAMRFLRIDALERRAADHDGEARCLLDARVAQLIDAYARDLKKNRFKAIREVAAPEVSSAGAVGGLLDYIDQASQRNHRDGADDGAVADDAAAPRAVFRAVFPQLGALAEFKALWSKLRVQSQLRESLEHAPTDAGPLNSGALVHRSLSLMRELSPEYAQQFLSYVDALAWIEQMSAGGVVELEDTLRTGSTVKRARDKPRKRRE